MIRVATVDDVPRVCVMFERFMTESAYAEVATPSRRALLLLIDLCLEVGRIFVAEVEGEVVGMLPVMLFPHPMTGGLMGEELAWWMAPEFRSGLLGPRLLVAAEAYVAAEGATLFKVVAPRGADRLAAFYARRGYREVETAWCKVLAQAS